MILQLFSQNIWFVLIISLPLQSLSRIKYSDALKKEFFERFTYNREVVQEAGMLFILINKYCLVCLGRRNEPSIYFE